ncbi:50S ribosomal protein L23 [Candidatus Kaiserbacteria bacterium]|nr:50S ribosomal protein L23 [Candidatus Kaiserbacteria bacterium]
MALFGTKKAKTEAVSDKPATKPVREAVATDTNLSAVIVGPRITEKAVKQSEQNVYTFNVRRDATKFQVRDAITAIYKVTPVKVNIVNKAPAKRMVGMRGTKKHVAGNKKAYVYLRKGDTINLV